MTTDENNIAQLLARLKAQRETMRADTRDLKPVLDKLRDIDPLGHASLLEWYDNGNKFHANLVVAYGTKQLQSMLRSIEAYNQRRKDKDLAKWMRSLAFYLDRPMPVGDDSILDLALRHFSISEPEFREQTESMPDQLIYSINTAADDKVAFEIGAIENVSNPSKYDMTRLQRNFGAGVDKAVNEIDAAFAAVIALQAADMPREVENLLRMRERILLLREHLVTISKTEQYRTFLVLASLRGYMESLAAREKAVAEAEADAEVRRISAESKIAEKEAESARLDAEIQARKDAVANWDRILEGRRKEYDALMALINKLPVRVPEYGSQKPANNQPRTPVDEKGEKAPEAPTEEVPEGSTEENAEGLTEGSAEGTAEGPRTKIRMVASEAPTAAPEAPTEGTAEGPAAAAQHRPGENWVDHKNGIIHYRGVEIKMEALKSGAHQRRPEGTQLWRGNISAPKYAEIMLKIGESGV